MRACTFVATSFNLVDTNGKFVQNYCLGKVSKLHWQSK